MPDTITPPKPQRRFPRLTRNRLPAGSAILAAAAVVAIIAVVLSSQNRVPVGKACSDKSAGGILEQAAPLLPAEKHQELEPLVSRIRSIKNYDKDPNCLNVVVNYYINISDYDKAAQYMEMLTNVYDPSEGFSLALGTSSKSIEELEGDVSFLKGQKEEATNNIFHGARLDEAEQ